MKNNRRYQVQRDETSPKRAKAFAAQQQSPRRTRAPDTSRSNEREQSPGRVSELRFQKRNYSPRKVEVTKKVIDIEASVKNVTKAKNMGAFDET